MGRGNLHITMSVGNGLRSAWKTLYQRSVALNVGILPGLLILGLVMGGRFAGALQFLEWRLFDTFLVLSMPELTDERVVIVTIDEQTIQNSGTYPIPDRDLARLIQQLQQYNPRVIGLDLFRDLPVDTGYEALKHLFQTTDNLIGIEKVLFPQVAPPPALPPQQVGIADAVLDADGRQRGVILGTNTPDGFKFSLALKVAQTYLKSEGIVLQNGIQDPDAMRFGSVELPRFYPNFGGYVRANTGPGSVQMLLNFRKGFQPFHALTTEDIFTNNYDPTWFHDCIVLIGVATPSVPDHFSVAATSVINQDASWVYGVEVQAHAVSQIISAVLDQRPLIRTWPESLEYIWILIWGLSGIIFAAYSRSPWQTIFWSFCGTLILIGFSYSMSLVGWWIPVVPVIGAMGLNSLSLVAFYEYERRIAAVVAAKQQRILALGEANTVLEQRVDERTQELSQTLAELKATQEQLIESAKMAALGQLVAGVAHEVNTPVGCAVMAASVLVEATNGFASTCQEGTLKRTVLTKYLETAREASDTILFNLHRANELIRNFKQIAADRTNWDKRQFLLRDYLEQVVRSLEPELRSEAVKVTILGDDDTELNSYPGAISQVIVNLVMNSINHGFVSKQQGHIKIAFTRQCNQVLLNYWDDGCGISSDHLAKIFEPFFTTSRSQGGTGLGLNIVYNIVTQNLHGTIRCESEVNVGTQFLIEFPISIPD